LDAGAVVRFTIKSTTYVGVELKTYPNTGNKLVYVEDAGEMYVEKWQIEATYQPKREEPLQCKELDLEAALGKLANKFGSRH
jgi:hypothetical protein